MKTKKQIKDLHKLKTNEVYYIIPEDKTTAVFARVSCRVVLLEYGPQDKVYLSDNYISDFDRAKFKKGQIDLKSVNKLALVPAFVRTCQTEIIPIHALKDEINKEKRDIKFVELPEKEILCYSSVVEKSNGDQKEAIVHELEYKDGMILENTKLDNFQKLELYKQVDKEVWDSIFNDKQIKERNRKPKKYQEQEMER